jgi:hypothetical protein
MILVGDNKAVKRRTRDLGYDSARLCVCDPLKVSMYYD